MATDKDEEKFDEIWIFAEKKMNASIPTYFKNVLKVCGYNNGITIATMGEEDVEYIENEVKNGNVAKFFTGDKKKLLEGSGRSAENFEFTRGHKKFLLTIVQFIKKHLDENGPDCFILEDVQKKQPIKKTIKNPVKRLGPTSRKRMLSEADYYVDSIIAEILLTQKSQEGKEGIGFSETIPGGDAHRKVILKKSITSLYCNARQIFDEKMESVKKQIFLRDFIIIKFKDLENDIQSANESTEELKIEATLEGAVRCPLCTKPTIVFHKPTEINTFLWNTSNFDRHLKLVHPQKKPLEIIETAPIEKINIRGNCTKPKNCTKPTNCTITSEAILSNETMENVNKKPLPDIEGAETYKAESPDCREESMEKVKIRDNVKKSLPEQAKTYKSESRDCRVEPIEKVKIRDYFTKPKNYTITSERNTIVLEETMEDIIKKSLSEQTGTAESRDCRVEPIQKAKIRDNFTKPKNYIITAERKTIALEEPMEYIIKKPLSLAKQVETSKTESSDCREEEHDKKPNKKLVPPSNVQAIVSYSDTSDESEEDQSENQAASLYHIKSKISKIYPEFGKMFDSNPLLNIKVPAETLLDFNMNTCPDAPQTTITNGFICEDAFMTPENQAILYPLSFIHCQRVPMLLNGYKSCHSKIVTKNTCAFDSITSIFACLYFDNLNFRAHIDSSGSKFSQLLSTFFNINNSTTQLTSSSYQKLYIDRNIVLKDLYYNWGSGKVVEKNGRIFIDCKIGIGDLFAQLCLRMHESIASAIEERTCNRCETKKGKLFPFLRISTGARDLQKIQSSINISLSDRSCTLCKSNYDMKRVYNNLLVLEVEPNESQSQDKIALKNVSKTINVNHKDYKLCGVIQYHDILEHFSALVRRVDNKWKSYDDIKYDEMDIEDSIEINPFLLFYISINNHNDFMTSLSSFLYENKIRQTGMPLIRKISRCDALLSETRHQQLENDQKSNTKRRQLEHSLGDNRKTKQSRLPSIRKDHKNDDQKDREDGWRKYF